MFKFFYGKLSNSGQNCRYWQDCHYRYSWQIFRMIFYRSFYRHPFFSRRNWTAFILSVSDLAWQRNFLSTYSIFNHILLKNILDFEKKDYFGSSFRMWRCYMSRSYHHGFSPYTTFISNLLFRPTLLMEHGVYHRHHGLIQVHVN